MKAPQGFPKYEHICKEGDIQRLFNQGVGFSSYPYRVIYLFFRDETRPVTCRLLVSVSKKRFHHAVKRNRVKRLTRESWRKNKTKLYEICQKDNISVDIAFVYTATVIHSYEEMFRKTKKVINELVAKYEKHNPTTR